MWDGHWSEPVAKLAVWLSGLVEYEDGAEILDRLEHIPMSTSSVWRRVEVWGRRGQAVKTAQRAQPSALPPRAEIVTGEARSAPNQGVVIDGAMAPIRDEGWKELKVGYLFEIKVKSGRDPQTGDRINLAQAFRNSCVAHLGRPEVFGQLDLEPDQRALLRYPPARCLASRHPTSVGRCARAPRRSSGSKTIKRRDLLAMPIVSASCSANRGLVECACKQFGARFSGPGMRWSRPGIERLLPVRAAVVGHSFDNWWKTIYKPPPNSNAPAPCQLPALRNC